MLSRPPGRPPPTRRAAWPRAPSRAARRRPTAPQPTPPRGLRQGRPRRSPGRPDWAMIGPRGSRPARSRSISVHERPCFLDRARWTDARLVLQNRHTRVRIPSAPRKFSHFIGRGFWIVTARDDSHGPCHLRGGRIVGRAPLDERRHGQAGDRCVGDHSHRGRAHDVARMNAGVRVRRQHHRVLDVDPGLRECGRERATEGMEIHGQRRRRLAIEGRPVLRCAGRAHGRRRRGAALGGVAGRASRRASRVTWTSVPPAGTLGA